MLRTRVRSIPDWVFLIPRWSYKARSRNYSCGGLFGAWITNSNFVNQPVPVTIQASRGSQYTVDELHPSWRGRDKPSAFSGDVGGMFDSRTSGVTIGGVRRRRAYGISNPSLCNFQFDAEYIGPFLARDPNVVPPAVSHSDLNVLGATAIARCKPTNNVADVSVAVGEIFREGLPNLFGASLWKDKTAAARGGSEYLNSEFGWKPLASSIKDVAYAAANADSILSHYERNAGQVVRRRYAFPSETTESSGIVGPSNGFIYSQGWNSSVLNDISRPMPNLRYTTRTFRSVWFSGAFTYHLPRGYNSRNGLVSAAAKAGPLLGIELTPDVVWNLTPWSWAIDWFSNAGDVVSNLSDWATDGLVMRYGYIMEHVRSETTYYLDGPSQFKFTDGLIPGTVTAWSESKRRRAASPFGFGVSWEGMTPRQLAITAALGLTRVFR